MKFEDVPDEAVEVKETSKPVDPNMEATKKEILEVSKVKETQEISRSSDPLDYWEIENLPSKGYYYPAGTKILGRRLKVKEVKKLGFMTDYNMEDTIESVLSSAIKGIDINKIYDDDKLYIVLWLRANTYREPGYKVSFMCSECETKSEYEFNLPPYLE